MRTKSGYAYEILGCGDPAIVACTCWTESSPAVHSLDSHWLRRLAQDRTLLVTNRRGFAGSSGHAGLDEEVLGLSEVVDEVGAPAVLLGGCEAAVVPIALAARQPERVQALIVVNGTARFYADGDYEGMPVGQTGTAADAVRRDWEGFCRVLLSDIAPVPWTDLDTLLELIRGFVTSEALAALFEGILQADVRDELAHIAVPTLVIHSTEDEVIPFGQAQYLVGHVAGARLHALQGARHHIDPSLNDEIAQSVVNFLSG